MAYVSTTFAAIARRYTLWVASDAVGKLRGNVFRVGLPLMSLIPRISKAATTIRAFTAK